MKTSPTLLFLWLLYPVCFIACRKDNNGTTGNDGTGIKPNLTEKTVASVNGFVSDENGEPVAFASVTAGDKTTLTDEYGYFACSNASLVKTTGLVKVSKNGFFAAYMSFLPQESRATFIRLKLLNKASTASVDAAAGGEAVTTEGAKVALPANGVVVADGGTAYTGQVQVSVHYIDPSTINGFQAPLPGDGRGIDKDGYLRTLKNYSTVAVELTGAAGQRLQIAEGKKATISLPIPSALTSMAPSTIALWTFNDSTGLWTMEGQATRSGSSYTATVSHFSFWAGAEAYGLVNFTARILNSAGLPLANVPVSVTQANVPQNAGYGKFGYTDADGYVSGPVLVNSSLVLDVLTPCATSAYSHAFTTTTSDLDLGTLTGNLGQGMVTISGTAVDCSNQPVTNGYVQTYDHGFYNRIAIVNGAFSFTGLACTNTEVSYVAIDKNANKQSDVHTTTLSPGPNALGELAACGTSTIATLSYTLNGATTTFSEPDRTPAGYYSSVEQGGFTTIIILGPDPNTDPGWSFQFDGGTALGSAHHFVDVFSNSFPSGRGWSPMPDGGQAVTITEYGKPGGFISGTFTGLILDFTQNTPYQNTTCTFRVRRNN